MSSRSRVRLCPSEERECRRSFLRLSREVVKNITQQTKECACLFFPSPIVATSQRIWTSSSTVGDAIKKSPGPHQSMGGRFYKDGRTDTVRTETKRKEKVKIALRSAIAQRTIFLFLLLFIYLYLEGAFLCLAHLFSAAERERERRKKWRCLVDIMGRDECFGNEEAEKQNTRPIHSSSMSGNYPKSCWLIITLRSQRRPQTFLFFDRETAQGRDRRRRNRHHHLEGFFFLIFGCKSFSTSASRKSDV